MFCIPQLRLHGGPFGQCYFDGADDLHFRCPIQDETLKCIPRWPVCAAFSQHHDAATIHREPSISAAWNGMLTGRAIQREMPDRGEIGDVIAWPVQNNVAAPNRRRWCGD